MQCKRLNNFYNKSLPYKVTHAKKLFKTLTAIEQILEFKVLDSKLSLNLKF